MSSTPVDLDALARQSGAVGATPTATPPTGGVDLDALARQSGAVGATPTATPSEAIPFNQAPTEVAKGFLKGVSHTLAGLISSPATATLIPGAAAAAPQLQRTADWIRQHTQTNNSAQQAGNIAETVAEYMALPEVRAETLAAKLPSVAEHFASGAKLAKYLSDEPKALTLMRMGLNSLKGGAEMGTQTYLKTGDIKAAAESAATGTVLSGGLNVIGEGAGALAAKAERAAPTMEEIAGREIPKFAAERPGVTPFEAGAVTPASAPELAAKIAPEAKWAYSNIATNAVQRSLDRLGLEADPVADLSEGTAQLGRKADAVYNAADEATGGDFRNINDEIRSASQDAFRSRGKARLEANLREDVAWQKMDDLLRSVDDPELRDTVQNARDVFRDHYLMDTVAQATNKSFNYPSEATALGAGQARVLNGGVLRNQLNKLESNPRIGRDRLTELLGEDGFRAMHRLANAADVPTQNQAMKNIIEDVVTQAHTTGAKTGFATGLLGHFLGGFGWGPAAAAGYGAGAAVGGSRVASQRLLGFIATSPRLMNMLAYAGSKGLSTTYAAKILRAGVNHELQTRASTPTPTPAAARTPEQQPQPAGAP